MVEATNQMKETKGITIRSGTVRKVTNLPTKEITMENTVGPEAEKKAWIETLL